MRKQFLTRPAKRRPLPAGTKLGGKGLSTPTLYQDSPHSVEERVQRLLLSDSRFHFSTLVVHRIADGVCVQGVVETEKDCEQLCSVIQSVPGVRRVLNQLVICTKAVPPKG